MQLDKLDIKIQEAARQYQPALDEQAWDTMEKLLDEHLPLKKNDRRKFIWLWLLLFLLAGTLFMITKPWNMKEEAFRSPEHNIISAFANVFEKVAIISENSTASLITGKKLPVNNPMPLDNSAPRLNLSINKAFRGKPAFENSDNQNNIAKAIIKDHSSLKVTAKTSADKENEMVKNNNSSDDNHYQSDDAPGISKTMNDEEKAGNKNIIKNEISNFSDKQNDIPPVESKAPSSKNKNKFSNSFALLFSAGPDVSAVDIGNIGKVNPVYGIGAGYNIDKHWTLRTGFYVTRKAYEAKLSDYHPPAGFWNYYPNLEYIDADCKVYEVPLIINYHFSETSKRLWFGSAGVSSYFMKKEKYDYVSKDPSGQYSYNDYIVNNKNKHFLSSLRFSGGYERKLNKNFTIITEPYINLPLTGVGFGKVKLHSAGILFTLSVKPFTKK